MTVSDLDGAENMIAIQYAEERNTARSLLHLNRIKNDPNVLTIANDLLKYNALAAAKVVKQAMDRNETMPADSSSKAMYNQFCSLYRKIDGNGVIRFQLIGFGSQKDEAHVNILSGMIELAKRSS